MFTFLIKFISISAMVYLWYPSSQKVEEKINESSLNESSLNESSLNESSLNESSLSESSLSESSLNEANDFKIQFSNHVEYTQDEDFEITYSRFTPEEIDFQLGLTRYDSFREPYPIDQEIWDQILKDQELKYHEVNNSCKLNYKWDYYRSFNEWSESLDLDLMTSFEIICDTFM